MQDIKVRAAFAERVAQALRKTAPAFKLADVADEGLQTGLITIDEADRLRHQLRMPDWLDLPDKPEQRDASLVEDRVLIEPSRTAFAPARVAPDTRLPPNFVSGSAGSPEVRLLRGGPSWHNLPNFASVSWAADGVFARMSTAEGRTLRPYLDAAEPVALDGTVFLAVVEGSSIYTHWLLDTLPRLLLAAEVEGSLDRFDTFLLATSESHFHRNTLTALGIAPSRVRTRQFDGTFVRVEAFAHVTAPRGGFVAAPGIYDRVRDFFAGPARPRPAEGRRVLLTRRKARRRLILNEPEVEALLQRYGFETVAFEDLSLAEVARLMGETSHLIAPHGAGLANLIFAGPGLKVLELFNAHLSPEYWRIAMQRGLEYHAMEVQAPDGSMITPEALAAMNFVTRNEFDLRVDVRALERYLPRFI